MIIHAMLRLVRVSIGFALFAQLIGCAAPFNAGNMVPDHVTLVHRLSGDVSVTVAGNRESSAVGASEISNDAFAQAIGNALDRFGLFTKVEPAGAVARYKLIAFVGQTDQQLEGPAQTVKMKVSYQLVDAPTGNTLWAQNVQSRYTATEGGYLAVVKRLRLANEGAARDNIQQMLHGISTLEICNSPEIVAPAAGECSPR